MSKYDSSRMSANQLSGGLKVVSQTLSSNTAPMFDQEFDESTRRTEETHLHCISKCDLSREP